jgi:integrase
MREMELASLPPSAVTAKHISSWVNDADKERGVGSRKVAIGHIHTFFSFLTASGWVASDPSKAVGIDYSVLSHEQKEPADRMPFTQDEISHIVAHFKSELYDLSKEIESVKTNKAYTEKGREAMLEKLWAKHRDLFFWLFAVVCSSKTGLRLSDIASLQWRSFESGKLVVWMEKTNQRIEHDCPEEIETMATQIALTNATYMFPDQHAIITNVKRRSLLSITFTRIIQRLGIVGKSFHSLRHTYASQVHKSDSKEELIKKLADSLSLAEVKKLLGHASVETTRGYIHK